MKLALVVLSCFVCLSQQERYIWPFPFAPNQASFKPLFYGNGLPAGYDIMKHDDSQHADALARNNAVRLPLQNRLFSNLLTGGLYFFTTTTSIVSTVTSTLTTASVIKCVPSSQFASTTACGRRRRDAAIIADLLVDTKEALAIKPDIPAPIETSAMVEHLSREFDSVPVATPDIVSSQKEEPTELSPDSTFNQERAPFTTTVSVTTTTTTFVLKATSLTSTITLGASTGLLCLPSGYTLCT